MPALLFLAEYLKVDQKEQRAIIKVLELILLPGTISSEATAMLSSVKRIVAKPLANSLQTYLHKRDPKNEAVTPLLDALKDSIPLSRRSGYADASEVTEWCRAEPQGLWTTLRTTTQGLMQWAIQPQMTVAPMSYTHRQFILGIKLMGPRRVLRMILEEVRRRHSDPSTGHDNNNPTSAPPTNMAAVVNDVATALICCPDVTNEPPAPAIDGTQSLLPQPQRLLTLREMLRMEADRCREIHKEDPLLADIVVRLHRRVEAQMEFSQPAPDGAGDVMGGTNQADMAAAAAAIDNNGGNDAADGGAGEMSLDAMAAMQGDPAAAMGLDMSSLDGLGGHGGDGDAGAGDADLFGGLDTHLDPSALDGIDWGDGMDLS